VLCRTLCGTKCTCSHFAFNYPPHGNGVAQTLNNLGSK
jgi:hypothetical protein